ncbi:MULTISPECIES: hypothetical protein [unclassified Ruegeria]|nr:MULTISPECIES: hypothetical protein [unclassified Ruegeria]NOD36918.1 hypothetical protein [Ruegeria sp. HKCCD7296]NOD48108.1 hypothetical protein [Ruegeria sp. HKCCD5849]NOD53469.1 hypothetical protein [Ruegeria sp. HKCCD5851]NOD70053.1 hypothetical protein [Ruegeria sp. HKCCD7303]NOE35909.1 hypothetical protein [Ruegeria sp. HKCCD7318]
MLPDLKGLSYLGALVYFHDAAESLSFLRATQALNAAPSDNRAGRRQAAV